MPGKIWELSFLPQLSLEQERMIPPLGPPEGLVGGGGHKVGVGQRGRVELGRHKSCNMSHVRKEKSPHFVGNFPKGGKVNDSRVGAGSGDNEFGLFLFGPRLE